MTSAEIRQSFLDFFKSKGHTIVPSASLLPDSPNLLFTNAGMNQFVPIFLGQRAPDVSKWPGAIPGSDFRAADTQKVIRAGGKHNDLDDVGMDTYHHTFFEMLGNWSFGNYFKKEAIEWAWELLTEVFKFPKNRLYATVYSPDKSQGDPSEFDHEASDIWTETFRRAGLDPKVHIVSGNKKDNFWMMGDTGPCGPCSEIHVDLTPEGATRGSLVNKGDPRCIEIWNLVFIQFNANPDGTFSPLPARHVDTGMGFERLTSFIQCTKRFTDFTRTVSNYETDIFRPLFDKIEKLSGRKYCSTLPRGGSLSLTPQQTTDVAFRVIADHIRTLGFAIADGIQPGNKGRNAVVRRILRRAAMFGRSLGFHDPFLHRLVSVLGDCMGNVFPEISAGLERIESVIQAEEEAFNKTLDSGMKVFEEAIEFCRRMQIELKTVRPGLDQIKSKGLREGQSKEISTSWARVLELREPAQRFGSKIQKMFISRAIDVSTRLAPFTITRPVKLPIVLPFEESIADLEASLNYLERNPTTFPGEAAFLLSATYGLPVEETERLARERGLVLSKADYESESAKHQELSRGEHQKEVIEVSHLTSVGTTKFIGYEGLDAKTKVAEIVTSKGKLAAILDTSPFYAEMGGQVGDTGMLSGGNKFWRISNTQRAGNAWIHFLESGGQTSGDRSENNDSPEVGTEVTASVDRPRRESIQRHHTVTHLLHWALHEVVSKDAVQKGSYVGPDKLTFDFSSAPLTPQQVSDVEKLVNEHILENAPVFWTEVRYDHVKDRKDIMQFFGEKYGDWVRVVQIGGKPTALDGYSMELCGGTHTRATGEIGLFRIVAESAIAAGIRRIEAVSGLEAYRRANEELQLIKNLAGKINSPVGELEKKVESLLLQQKELEKQLQAARQKRATETARELIAKAQSFGSTRGIVENVGTGDADFLQSIADALKGQFNGVVVLGGTVNGAVALVATVSPELTKSVQAGKLIQAIAPIVGGKGGGRPENARGGGRETKKLDEALAHARKLIA